MIKYIIDVIVHIHQEIITNSDKTPHIDRTTNQTTEILHIQITITSNRPRDRNCYYCNKPGHTKGECRQLQDDKVDKETNGTEIKTNKIKIQRKEENPF